MGSMGHLQLAALSSSSATNKAVGKKNQAGRRSSRKRYSSRESKPCLSISFQKPTPEKRQSLSESLSIFSSRESGEFPES